jgi:hypothetical protein
VLNPSHFTLLLLPRFIALVIPLTPFHLVMYLTSCGCRVPCTYHHPGISLISYCPSTSCQYVVAPMFCRPGIAPTSCRPGIIYQVMSPWLCSHVISPWYSSEVMLPCGPSVPEYPCNLAVSRDVMTVCFSCSF